MNYKNKPSLFKRESFYIILFLVLAIVATIVAIAVRNSSNSEESKVSTNTTSTANNTTVASATKTDLNLSSNLEEQTGPANSLQVKNEDSNDQNLASVTEGNVNSGNDMEDNANLANDTNSAINEEDSNVAVDVTPQQDETIVSDNATVSNENVSSETAQTSETTDENVALDDNNSDSEQVAAASGFNFLKPVAGQVITDYDKLIEGKTENGNQWITFSNGIEISASVGAPVKAVSDGEILAIDQDLNGAIVTMDHGNGIKTVYKNLDGASLLINAGDKVTQNQQIGNIGEVKDAYIEKGPRLCFELIRNGEYQDPSKYIKY